MSRLQQTRSDETRSGLLAAARTLFTNEGYANTSTEQVVAAAGVTRGALYHHFDSKLALFREVFVSLEEEFVATARRVSSPGAGPWANLVAACHAFLDTCLDGDVQRIVLVDGPAVLGPEQWRAIEDRYALAPIVRGLELARRAGVVRDLDVRPLARMLLAAINEAGLFIAQADEPREARASAGRALDAVLGGLRADPTGAD